MVEQVAGEALRAVDVQVALGAERRGHGGEHTTEATWHGDPPSVRDGGHDGRQPHPAGSHHGFYSGIHAEPGMFPPARPPDPGR